MDNLIGVLYVLPSLLVNLIQIVLLLAFGAGVATVIVIAVHVCKMIEGRRVQKLCSEIILEDAIQYVEDFLPVKITFNGKVLYNDYDSRDVIEVLDDGSKVYGERLPPDRVVPDRIKNFSNSTVTSIRIQVVDYHHSIVILQGKYKEIQRDKEIGA